MRFSQITTYYNCPGTIETSDGLLYIQKKGNLMKNRILNRLEYAGLEYLFQNIITTYETEYKGIIPCDISPASEIIKELDTGFK